MTESTQHDRYAEEQDALLAWAREKARHPFTVAADGFICAFCMNKQAVFYDGRFEVAHAPGCLALRCVTEGVA